MEECANQAFFEMMETVPLNLVYEDYIQDMCGTVQKIINFLEIKDEYTFQEPLLRKMADALSEEWEQRYREELQANWGHKRW